ncbi:MAG TPA: hypothetical protein PKV73_01270 [Agriterribacter sp.]|nr:hypothetical protein [Agriterribacter sp.]
MRVLTFSRFYPAYHPKKGKPTFFVEKIVNGLNQITNAGVEVHENVDFNLELYYLCDPKFHTIRAGSRWKVGDWFSPRVWSDKPYRSKQIEFAPPIQVKKVWPITIRPHKEHGFVIHIKDRYVADWEGTANITQSELAKNDGLEKDDLLRWFRVPKPFTGQIICWNENINY